MRACLFLPAAAVLLFAGAVAEAQTESVPEPDERVVAIYDQLAVSLARLKSIEYAATETMTNHLPLPADSHMQPVIRDELHHTRQGDRFFSRIDSADPERQWSHEGAYDGKHFQEYSRLELRISSDLPKNFTSKLHSQPIVVPLNFVFDYGVDPIENLFSTLLNEATWQRLIPDSTWLRTESVNDHLCDVVQVRKFHKKWNVEFMYRVFLDHELDYYPVKWECDITPLPEPDGTIKGERAGTEGVVQTKVFDTSAGRVVVPIVVTWDVFFEGKLGRSMELRIDPETLRVNEPIEESVFTIPRDLALRVIDETADGDP